MEQLLAERCVIDDAWFGYVGELAPRRNTNIRYDTDTNTPPTRTRDAGKHLRMCSRGHERQNHAADCVAERKRRQSRTNSPLFFLIFIVNLTILPSSHGHKKKRLEEDRVATVVFYGSNHHQHLHGRIASACS